MSASKFVFCFLALISAAATQHLEETPDVGSTKIVNNMGSTIYMWSVADEQGPMMTIPPGGSYREIYRFHPNGGGVSIKLATTPDITNIIQFEYTRAGEKIFWDVSCVDTKPNSLFYAKGISLEPSSKDCPAFTCAPGDTKCRHVYHKWNDDHAAHGCHIDTSFTFKLGI
ncbi:hypothetical protein BDV29DRAFT_160414 [Aspergillus leporis]|uniref:Uncharacterized protein n=1 Tax=Aspergillus leporis TaxID=41062 RepID=A0A5N5WRZ5_9EURO|nr:hypothetical protein BDV29DRAFT_160414 [Aspergillus leporis]